MNRWVNFKAPIASNIMFNSQPAPASSITMASSRPPWLHRACLSECTHHLEASRWLPTSPRAKLRHLVVSRVPPSSGPRLRHPWPTTLPRLVSAVPALSQVLTVADTLRPQGAARPSFHQAQGSERRPPTSATSPRAHPANVLRAGGQRFLTALFTPAQWKRLFLLVEGTGGGMLVFTGL